MILGCAWPWTSAPAAAQGSSFWSGTISLTIFTAKVVSYGVLTLSKPTNMQMVAQNLRILCATRERMRQMEAKQATVEEKIEEIRLVNRAKWLLIECLGMTEPEAHRYIEKQAMDRCVTRRAVAEQILSTYQ